MAFLRSLLNALRAFHCAGSNSNPLQVLCKLWKPLISQFHGCSLPTLMEYHPILVCLSIRQRLREFDCWFLELFSPLSSLLFRTSSSFRLPVLPCLFPQLSETSMTSLGCPSLFCGPGCVFWQKMRADVEFTLFLLLGMPVLCSLATVWNQ